METSAAEYGHLKNFISCDPGRHVVLLLSEERLGWFVLEIDLLHLKYKYIHKANKNIWQEITLACWDSVQFWRRTGLGRKASWFLRHNWRQTSRHTCKELKWFCFEFSRRVFLTSNKVGSMCSFLSDPKSIIIRALFLIRKWNGNKLNASKWG